MCGMVYERLTKCIYLYIIHYNVGFWDYRIYCRKRLGVELEGGRFLCSSQKLLLKITDNSKEYLSISKYLNIFREKLLQFLWKLKQPDGSFEMHEGGEIDMRSIYCAVSIAKLTNIYSEELFKNSAEWIVKCQTYEGGFAGCPNMESHGGYSFCGLAALVLLNKENLLNLPSFIVS